METYLTKRTIVPSLEEIIGEECTLLDGKGKLVICDYMGSDETIARAARTSYKKGTKTVNDDKGLIRYLMRHRHSTPGEMPEILMYVKAPLFVIQQWLRHRTCSFNQTSHRYSIASEDMLQTDKDKWRKQSSQNNQGSEGFLDEKLGAEFSEDEQTLQVLITREYKRRLDAGIAREQARKDLSHSTYSELFIKQDAHNLLHFASLRSDPHSQWEIRQYSDLILHEVIKRWLPISYQAFLDYRFNAISLTAQDIETIAAINSNANAKNLLESWGWIKYNEKGKLLKHRERSELEEKLKQLNMEIPWKKV